MELEELTSGDGESRTGSQVAALPQAPALLQAPAVSEASAPPGARVPLGSPGSFCTAVCPMFAPTCNAFFNPHLPKCTIHGWPSCLKRATHHNLPHQLLPIRPHQPRSTPAPSSTASSYAEQIRPHCHARRHRRDLAARRRTHHLTLTLTCIQSPTRPTHLPPRPSSAAATCPLPRPQTPQ